MRYPNAKTYKSRLYDIYNDPEVKDDLNRQAKPDEPLPDLIANGYYLLGYDWRGPLSHGRSETQRHGPESDHDDRGGFEPARSGRVSLRARDAPTTLPRRRAATDTMTAVPA